MKFKVLWIAGLMLVTTAVPVHASFVSLGEAGNTRVSAQNVDGYYDMGADANIFDSTTIAHVTISAFHDAQNDLDWFSFTGQAGASIMLDIDTDGYGGGFDATMHLFDANGTLIAYNDDAGYDPGSTTDGLYYYNAFIGSYTLTSSGAFYVAVSDYANFANGFGSGSFTSLVRPDTLYGGEAVTGATFGDDSFSGNGFYGGVQQYNLHISNTVPLSAAVPEPASIAMWGLGALGLVLAGRKRRQMKLAA